MDLIKAINELQDNLMEIKRQYKLKRLRSILKFLLIGFLIGRDSDSKVSALNANNNLIIKRICEHFEDLGASQKIKEFVNAYTTLSDIEAKLRVFENDLKINQSISEIEGLLRKRHEIVGYIKRIIEQKEEDINEKVEKIVNSGTYLTFIEKECCLDVIKSLLEDLAYCAENKVLENGFVLTQKGKLEKHIQTISDYNAEFIKRRKKDYKHLWSKGLLSLDDEQQTAIVTDDKYNLVVAAAGSGKTEVLITRIAYLITRSPDRIQPQRILAIAYQRKAKDEIEQRLRDHYKIENVNVRTFHKLGIDILRKAGKIISRTDIIDENKKHEIIKTIFEQKISNEPAFYTLFLEYVKTLHNEDAEEANYETIDEILSYARKRAYFSIDNTRVNSRAEKEIMDFLLTNKINGAPIVVAYEPGISGFRPDFCLPQYDLFIEHWALNKEGEVPNWFDQPTEKYKESMETKKKWFADHDKLLVETFTHEYDENKPDEFIELLKLRIIEKLQSRHNRKFEFTLKTYDEIVEIVWGTYKTPIDDIVNFITTAKTYGLTTKKIADRLVDRKWSSKQLAFGNLVMQVYPIYEDELQKKAKIDFEDMINNAIKELDNNTNLYATVYDHILIDEYQDISAQRLALIKKLLERNPYCKLFCVGDDWQSIMGFSGSNLNFFVNFREYFEKPAITKICTNYRSVKSIVDAAADLIRNNDNHQVPKLALSNRKEIRPIMIFRSPHKMEFANNYYHQTAEDCLARIVEYSQRGYAANDVLILTRFIRTRVANKIKFPLVIQILLDKAKEHNIGIACDNANAQSKVRLLTVHKSKGIEAKVVFILNVIKGIYGFPCEIEDSSIYEPARDNYPIQDQKEEERRLFYVAMTRAKEDLYIYTWEPAKSEFLEEIKNHTHEIRLRY
jgi:DNA helicase-4